MAERYKRWPGMSTEQPLETVPQIAKCLRHAVRQIDQYLRANNEAVETTDPLFAGILVAGNLPPDFFCGEFELSNEVMIGHLVYFDGRIMIPADTISLAMRPVGVALSRTIGSRGMVWLASGVVTALTYEAFITPGTLLFLGAGGTCTFQPAALHPIYTRYQIQVGWALGLPHNPVLVHSPEGVDYYVYSVKILFCPTIQMTYV